jgi:DNA repair protein RadC
MKRGLCEYGLGEVVGAPAAFYHAPVIRLKIIRESTTETPRQIKSPADAAAALMDRFGSTDREVFVAVLLDTKNKVLAIDPCFVGSLDRAIVTMREAFKGAMLVGAAAVIFAHNHPSGDPEPSPEDQLLTVQLVAAGKLLDIDTLDHLVLGAGCYTSLRERGIGGW